MDCGGRVKDGLQVFGKLRRLVRPVPSAFVMARLRRSDRLTIRSHGRGSRPRNPGAFFTRLAVGIRPYSTMVREAVNQASLEFENNAELKEVLHDIADERGDINRRKLGRWIKLHEGRIVDGLKFVRDSGKRSAEAWKVESVLSISVDPKVKLSLAIL